MAFTQYMILINKLQVQMQSWATEKFFHIGHNMKVYLLDCLFLWSVWMVLSVQALSYDLVHSFIPVAGVQQ
jgi:hypothetical protein